MRFIRRQIFVDLLTCLSLANIMFFKSWVKLLDVSVPYHDKHPPAGLNYPALMLDVLLVGIIAFFAVQMARLIDRQVIWRIGGGLTLILLGVVLPLQSARLWWVAPAALLLLWVFLAGGIGFWLQGVRTTVAKLLLFTSPVLLVTYGNAFRAWMQDPVRYPDQKPAPLLDRNAPPNFRVLWLVLDEWDYRIAFEKRPADVKMPNFDKLLRSSFSASQAYPPAGETFRSMPAMILGRYVASAEKVRADDLKITFGNAQGEKVDTELWSRSPTLFTKASKLNANSALLGIYHPYCRIIGNQLNHCSWWEYGVRRRESGLSNLGEAMVFNFCRFSKLYPYLWRCESKFRRETMLKNYLEQRDETQDVLRDSRYDLIFSHFGVPHAPAIYDRSADAYSVEWGPGYLDNLELIDRLLGELLSAIEEADTLDQTVILLTSDHSLRVRQARVVPSWTDDMDRVAPNRDYRVPFIVHFPRESKGITYERPFNGILAHDLTLAILSGGVTSVEEVPGWINARREIGRSPWD